MKPHSASQVASVIGVTCLAIICGGSHDLANLTALFVIAGLSAILLPGQHRPGWKRILLFASIVCLAVASYLPADWFHRPAWRTALASDATISLPDTLTAQPWKTAQSAIMLCGSLSWLSYLVTLSWKSKCRRHLIQSLMAALSILALGALFLESRGQAWPWGAEHPEQYSPFANRNQLATLCAMSLALHVSALAASFPGRHYRRIGFLVVGGGIALAALVTIGSRAGLALGVFGSFSALAMDAWRRRSPRVITVTAAIALFGLAAVFLSDSRLADRLTADKTTTVKDLQTGRLAIYSDTLSQATELPFVGHGLGNFAQVFPFYRDRSVSGYHLRHPESDWLWWWSEMGWGIFALAAAGIYVLVRNRPSIERKKHERSYDHALRLGLLGAALVFMIHSFVDVPAHRIGTLWVGLLVFSLAFPLNTRLDSNSTPIRNFTPFVCGLIAGLISHLVPQSSVHQAPLAWQGYFQRALSHLEVDQDQNALSDFQRARFLEPISYKVPLAEGEAWLTHGHPSYAIAAWREAMTRNPANADAYYERFLKLVKQDDGLAWESLLALAEGRPQRLRHYQALKAYQANR